MKVAICLSGESRTYQAAAKNIRNFFSESKFDFTYFGHTWSANSWKLFDENNFQYYEIEQLDISELSTGLNKEFPFEKLKISQPLPRPENPLIPWYPMSYSGMMANYLKQQYELEKDMKFDLVVHYRYDECMYPTHKFSRYVPDSIRDTFLYSQISLFTKEYRQHNVNDIFYFGSSKVMDIIQNFYRVYHNGNFFNLVNSNECDRMYQYVGYGVLLYKWATLKNIHVEDFENFGWQIARRGSEPIITVEDFMELSKKNESWGRK